MISTFSTRNPSKFRQKSGALDFGLWAASARVKPVAYSLYSLCHLTVTMKRGFSVLSSLTDGGSDVARKRPKKKTAQQKTKLKTVSDDAVDAATDATHSDAALADITIYKELFDKLQKRVEQLSAELKQQQQVTKDLSNQLSSVVSVLQGGNADEFVAAAVSDFAAAVKRPVAAMASDSRVQESIVAAVYIDTQRRQNRATNFIVSGLPVSDVRPDQQAVVDLCRSEFGEAPDVVHCKRLGKLMPGRVQPILVVLKTAAQAVRIVAAAKNIRQSADPVIRQNVFISANLTKAEARAAYEARCQRRLALERKKNEQRSHNISAHHDAAGAQQQHLPSSSPASSQQQPAASRLPSRVSRVSVTGANQQQQQAQNSVISVDVHHPPAINRLPPPPPTTQQNMSSSDFQLQQERQLQQQQHQLWQQSQQSQLPQQLPAHFNNVIFDQQQQLRQPQHPVMPMTYSNMSGAIPLTQQQPLTAVAADFTAVPTYSLSFVGQPSSYPPVLANCGGSALPQPQSQPQSNCDLLATNYNSF